MSARGGMWLPSMQRSLWRTSALSPAALRPAALCPAALCPGPYGHAPYGHAAANAASSPASSTASGHAASSHAAATAPNAAPADPRPNAASAHSPLSAHSAVRERLTDLEGFLSRAGARLSSARRSPPSSSSAAAPPSSSPAPTPAWTASDLGWIEALKRQGAAPHDQPTDRTRSAIVLRLLGYSDPVSYVQRAKEEARGKERKGKRRGRADGDGGQGGREERGTSDARLRAAAKKSRKGELWVRESNETRLSRLSTQRPHPCSQS